MRTRVGSDEAEARVNIEEVHRYMWGLVDERFRVGVAVKDVAAAFGTVYRTMNHAMKGMRDQGRIKHVATRPGKLYVYEVTNPNTYDRRNPETQIVTAKRPAWG